MASLTYLDTHVLVWAITGLGELLSPRAVEALTADEIRISPMVVLELEFLREIGRLTPAASEMVMAAEAELGVTVCDIAFRRVIERARSQTFTRDPFDRVIVGHALAAGGQLLTRDETIRYNVVAAFW